MKYVVHNSEENKKDAIVKIRYIILGNSHSLF